MGLVQGQLVYTEWFFSGTFKWFMRFCHIYQLSLASDILASAKIHKCAISTGGKTPVWTKNHDAIIDDIIDDIVIN